MSFVRPEAAEPFDPDLRVRTHERWDAWVRWLLFHYVFGTIIGTHLLFVTEVVLPLPLGFVGKALFCVVFVPLGVMALGAGRRVLDLVASRGAARHGDGRVADGALLTLRQLAGAWRWTLAALLAFGVWAGGYMAVGWWTADRPALSVGLALDEAIPLVPEFVFLYLAVYPMILLPFLLGREPQHFWPMVRAYGVVLLTCYSIFLVFPVALHHPPLAGESFSEQVLGLVYGNDPPTNCLPSTHCAMSLLAAICLYRVARPVGWWAFLVAFSIGVSTLFSRQHYLLDVVAGWGVALLAIDLAWDGRIRAWYGRVRSQWALVRPR